MSDRGPGRRRAGRHLSRLVMQDDLAGVQEQPVEPLLAQEPVKRRVVRPG